MYIEESMLGLIIVLISIPLSISLASLLLKVIKKLCSKKFNRGDSC